MYLKDSLGETHPYNHIPRESLGDYIRKDFCANDLVCCAED